jgi:hypothetical protein
MRRAGWILAVICLAACNANPLLHEASANYAPVSVGDRWVYNGTNIYTVSAALNYQGRAAYSVAITSTLNNSIGTEYWSFDGGDWLAYNGVKWLLYRRLPYVVGNSWPIYSNNPAAQVQTLVDSVENISLASGYYANCFKLRTVTQTYAGGVTTTTETDAWVAPGVGDVQYGQVDASGTASVTGVLTAYQVH